jgi:hypothetical protein
MTSSNQHRPGLRQISPHIEIAGEEDRAVLHIAVHDHGSDVATTGAPR